MASKSTINITFKLDGDSKGFQDLAKDANGLKTVMASAVVEAEKFKASIINWNQSIQAMSAVSNAVGSLNSALQNVTAESNSFSKAMRAANTMAGKDAEGFADLKGQVAELAKQIPVARDELANGLYQVISNGVPEDNWIEFLEKSARSSVGGIADLGQAVTVTSTIIKNYGLSWEEAGNIQDKIQLTAKNGVTSFEQLADALPTVAGSAAQLGVSIDELMAIFATCTGVTGNTSEVSTQLAAVLKSLIKPSSEAAKAAEKMGISFNAAAVREAGGLDNFLKNVDAAIQQYSAKTGELSETIYGQLFGSARSLRLLTSLTGEQAQKFTENIGLMVDSAGTMDAAYENMAGTVSAQTQIFQNQIATMTDVVASFIAPYQPMLNLVTQMGQLTLSTTIMIRSFSQLRKGITPMIAVLKNVILSMGALTTSEGRATLGTTGFGTAAAGATLSTKLFGNALRGLLVATGIGIAIAALSVAVEALSGKFKKASKEVEELTDDEKAFQDASVRAQGAINAEVAKLSALMKSHGDTSKEVEHLNQVYGDSFGTYNTAAQWYNVLTTRSKEYCKQLGLEAQARTLGVQLAQDQLAADEAEANLNKIKSGPNGGMVSMSNTVTTASGFTNTTQWKTESEELRKANQLNDEAQKKLAGTNEQWKILQKAIEDNEKAMKGATTATNTLGDAVETKVDAPTGKVVKSATQLKTRYQEISDEINKLTNDYVTASDEQREGIREQIALLSQEKDQIELTMAEATRPQVLDSLKAIDAEIQYQTKLLQTQGEDDAKITQQTIDDLRQMKSEWTEIAEEVEEFHIISPSEVKNIEDGEKMIEHFRELQKTASADQYTALQKEINAYEARNSAISRGGDLLSMQSEVDSLNSLGGRELRIMVRAEGYDSFVSKINDLKAMLNDTLNPPTDEQRQQIESLIAAYSKLGAQAALSFGTLKDGWSSVEGIGNGIKGITDTLNDDADAWTKITSIVDDFIQIYEGVNKVISIIEALTLASSVHATTKTVEGAEVQTEAGMEVAAAGETVAANAITTASNAVAAASFEKLAASAIFAAHAYIPFAGVGIATGFVAEMEAVLASIGAIGAFAEGGIAYGPTLGLFGEYAGASTNPEVVAPLDKLRSMLKTDEGMGGRVRFTIEGRTLVGILERENRVMSRR